MGRGRGVLAHVVGMTLTLLPVPPPPGPPPPHRPLFPRALRRMPRSSPSGTRRLCRCHHHRGRSEPLPPIEKATQAQPICKASLGPRFVYLGGGSPTKSIAPNHAFWVGSVSINSSSQFARFRSHATEYYKNPTFFVGTNHPIHSLRCCSRLWWGKGHLRVSTTLSPTPLLFLRSSLKRSTAG